MLEEIRAEVGAWYQNNVGQVFEVVAVDVDEGTVEIQYFEGEIEELDMDTWAELELTPIEPPEDWTGAYDELNRDDLGYSDQIQRPEDWSGPLGVIEPEQE